MRFYLTNIDNEGNFGRMGNGIGQVMTKEEWHKLVVVMNDFYNKHSEEEINRYNDQCEDDVYKHVNKPVEKKKTLSNVYFIKSSDGFIKIGVSKNVKKRLNQLQISSPYKLELVYSFSSYDAYEDESVLHAYYKDKKMTNEWFDINDSELSLMINKIESGDSIYG